VRCSISVVGHTDRWRETHRRKASETAVEDRKQKEQEEKKRKETEEAARKAALTEDDFKENPEGLSDWCKEKGNSFYKQKQFEEVGVRSSGKVIWSECENVFFVLVLVADANTICV